MSDILRATETAFRPVKALESKIQNATSTEGYVYFTTDTKKIYLGSGGKFIPMGGNSGIYYGLRIPPEGEGDLEIDTFTFTSNEIEGDNIPNVNDLILNSPDGCFYRVKTVNAQGQIIAQKLTVAGSGGGAGPGGGGGGGMAKPTASPHADNKKYISANDLKYTDIRFIVNSLTSNNNYINTIEISFNNEATPVTVYEDVQFGENFVINLEKYKSHLNLNGSNTISIIVQDVYGNRSYKSSAASFDILTLKLTPVSKSIIPVKEAEKTILDFRFKPSGGASVTGASRFTEITLAPVENPSEILLSVQREISSFDTVTANIDLKDLAHGTYILKATYYVAEGNNLIGSNTLTHQVLFIKADNDTPIIASDFVDQTIPQYSQLVVQYMIAKGSLNTKDKVTFWIENETSDEDVILNEVNEWKPTFVNIGTYTISLEYEGKKQRLGAVTVEKYSDDNVPTIDTSIVELYLTAMGKSNTQTNKAVWEWNNHGQVYSARFENFLWGNENGWIEDPNGIPALKLTNGAKLSIPNYFPFAQDATVDGLTIELDFMFSNVMNYNEPLIKCLSANFKTEKDEHGNPIIDNYATGINITGQKATLNSKKYKPTTQAIENKGEEEIKESDMALQALTQFFNEDTKIHLTYVIQDKSNTEYRFIYTYVNGILSGIMKMDSDEAFKENSGDRAIFEFDSTFADIYLYGIRTYRQPLSPYTVIDNYIADIGNIDEKIRLAKNNDILNLSNKVSKNAIDALGMALGVPYVIFEGGIEMPKKFKKKDLGANGYKFAKKNYALPVRKDDYRLMAMDMYEKDETGKISNTIHIPISLGEDADSTTTISSFDAIDSSKPYWFNRGVQVYGQGTSSMVYPVKNLRLKFIDKGDYPSIADSEPLEIVCFKADFMDSAASHNTPTGNLVDTLYEKLNMKTPPQDVEKYGSNKGKVYTAIKGFPIICFYKDYNNEDEEEEYIYIGRYNFNIDKATPEPFGFTPKYKETGEVVTDSQGRERKVVNSCGYRVEIVNDKTVLPLDEEGKEIKDDIIQCWEWLNNDTNSPTKFLTPEKADGSKYASFDEALQNAWPDYYEDRYPDEIVGYWEDYGKVDDDGNPKVSEEEKAWADDALEKGLFRLTRWVNSTSTDSNEMSNAELAEPVYYKTLDKAYDSEIEYYDSNYNKVTVVETGVVNVSTGTLSKEDKFDKATVTINKDVFIAKVGEKNYNSYNFSYTGGKWFIFKDGSTVEVNLSDYGISVSAELKDGYSIIIDYVLTYGGWNANLLEKHTKDDARYRLAKFKSEFTQYFNLNYCLYYYLLTLILLMMDSRAKNMMMASWDQTIWYPIFYDMDTMLGLNNTGFNKFSYDTEDDPEDKVFNGYDSVLWNNFRTCFGDEIANFYNRLRSASDGAGLDLNLLLETYNENSANKWVEALITEDAIYKYERPYKEGYYDGKAGAAIAPGAVNYLYAAQGRRSNHRAWWLKNRLGYLDSKYKPVSLGNQKPGQSEAFSFRAYALPSQQSSASAQACVADAPANHQFDITALTNSYQSLFIGNIVYGPIYTAANQTVKIGPTFPKHEVESYILNPELIADLGDLSDKYIGSWQMPTNRLTALRFGRSSRSHGAGAYENDFWNNGHTPVNYNTYYNSLLTSLNVGENTPYLSYLNIARCTGLPTIDISKCNKLQILDAEGSALTGITFPQNSILEEIYIPTSIKNLEIKNQPYLKVIKFDETGEDPVLTSLILENVGAFDSYQIAKKTFANTLNDIPFVLTNIDWRIDDFADGETVNRIPILERLLEEGTKVTPATGYDLATALTGKITLGGNIKANEFTIYSRYKKYFPDLTIEFDTESGVEVTKAYVIQFLNDQDATIPYYQVKTDGSLTLEELITNNPNNPNGYALTEPEKDSTLELNFVFSGYWKDKALERFFYSPTLFTPSEPLQDGAISFADINYKPKSDMTFYPYYSFTQKVYQIVFHDENGNLITLPMSSGNTTETPTDQAYLSYYNKKYDGPIKNFYYKDDSGLPANKKYAFKGWGTTRNAILPEFVNLDDLTITSNMNLYAYFEEVSVNERSNKHWEYFTYSGSMINLKSDYKGILEGKITLPSKHPTSGTILTTIGDFREPTGSKIKEIFFETDAKYASVSDWAFGLGREGDASLVGVHSALQAIYLPETITSIGESAFKNLDNLLEVNMSKLNSLQSIGNDAFMGSAGDDWHIMKVRILELPTSLTHLGSSAFYLGGSGIQISKLPPKLTTILGQTFCFCPNVRITEFGASNGQGITRLDNMSLFQTGIELGGYGNVDYTHIPEVDTVIFHPSLTTLSSGVFGQSYMNKVTTFYFAHSPSEYIISDNDPKNTYEELLAYLNIEPESASITIKGKGDW